MWKIAVGFVVFAALALVVIFKGGDKIDMGGEKHGTEATHAPAAASTPLPATSAAGPVPTASAAQPEASAASAAKK